MTTAPPTAVNPTEVNPTPLAPVDSPRIFPYWKDALAFFNKEFCYIRTVDAVVRLSDLEVFRPDTFASRQYGNFFYSKAGDDGNSRTLPAPKEWLKCKERNQRDKMTYAPGEPTYTRGALNRWKKLGSVPKAGDVSPWTELLNFLFEHSPKERKFFEQWIAYPLQHLGTKMKTCAVLYSRKQGMGKNILVEAVERIYGSGSNAYEIGENQLYADFNGWQKDRQFIVGDEVQGGRDKRKVIERLKALITSPNIEINEKYKPPFSIPNVANFIFLSNNPDPFYVADEDRRFWAWEIPDKEPLPLAFYHRFREWKNSEDGIAALHYHLLHVDTSDFDPHAHAPMTELKKNMIDLGRTELERWLHSLPDEAKRTLFTPKDLLRLWHVENEKSFCNESSVIRALKKLNYKQANQDKETGEAKQVKVRGKALRLWVVAKGADAERLHSMAPGELAAEYERWLGPHE